MVVGRIGNWIPSLRSQPAVEHARPLPAVDKGTAAAAAAAAAAAKLLQLCPTLCNPIDSSPPGFPIPGILQARTLEWVGISFSHA